MRFFLSNCRTNIIRNAFCTYNHVLSEKQNYKPSQNDGKVNDDVFVGMNHKIGEEKTSKKTKIEDFSKSCAFFPIRFQMVR